MDGPSSIRTRDGSRGFLCSLPRSDPFLECAGCVDAKLRRRFQRCTANSEPMQIDGPSSVLATDQAASCAVFSDGSRLWLTTVADARREVLNTGSARDRYRDGKDQRGPCYFHRPVHMEGSRHAYSLLHRLRRFRQEAVVHSTRWCQVAQAVP